MYVRIIWNYVCVDVFIPIRGKNLQKTIDLCLISSGRIFEWVYDSKQNPKAKGSIVQIFITTK